MRDLFAGLLVFFAGVSTVQAADLQGRYQFQRQGHNGTYFGIMVVNDQGEVRLKGTSPSQNYSECGYVRVKGDKIDVIFTTAKGDRGYSADHFYCRAGQSRSLTCTNVDVAGQSSGQSFVLTRTGDIPATPEARLEDICAPGQIPRS